MTINSTEPSLMNLINFTVFPAPENDDGAVDLQGLEKVLYLFCKACAQVMIIRDDNDSERPGGLLG